MRSNATKTTIPPECQDNVKVLTPWGLRRCFNICRGCTDEEFPTRKPKIKSFWFHVHNQNCSHQPRRLGFFPTPSLANFIKHHVHWNQPPWQRICKDDIARQRSCMGASLARATTLSKPQVHHSQMWKPTHRAHNNQCNDKSSSKFCSGSHPSP